MQEIADWLEKLGMSEYAQRFAEDDIDALVLQHLTDQDLKELGVSLGHRRKMLAAIGKLSKAVQGRHCLLRITSAPEDGGARPSAPSALSAQEIVPCAPTALPVVRRWTVDGRSGWSCPGPSAAIT